MPTITLPEAQQRYLDWLLDPRLPQGVPTDAQNFKGSQKWLAQAMGVDPSVYAKWRKDPRFRRAWDEQILEASGGPERLQALLEELYKVAVDKDARPADKVAAIKLHLDVTERHTPRTQVRIEDPALLNRDDRDLLERADAMAARIQAARREALVDAE